MNRITEKNPIVPWKQENGRNIAQIDNYYLDYAYGGVQVVQVVNDGGGIRNVLNSGFVPKRECFDLLNAFINGYQQRFIDDEVSA